MSVSLPYSLSPSRVSSFTDCPLAFRFSSIDNLPQAPTVPATKGTLVHSALEQLFSLPTSDRTPDSADGCFLEAKDHIQTDPTFLALELSESKEQTFFSDARKLVQKYFELEDPRTIQTIGIELKLEVTLGDLRLRGIIDRLDLDKNGELIVVDYKTGRPPHALQEQAKLVGVHFYAYMCEQLFGKRPAAVKLLYLSQPVTLITSPSEQSTRGLERKVLAIWAAIERACEKDDFRPKASKLCDWCGFQSFCPVFGGDPKNPERFDAMHSMPSAQTRDATTAPVGPSIM